MKKNKQSEDSGTAIWINEVGSIKPRVFKIRDRSEGKVTLDFGNNETYRVLERNMRQKRLVMWKTSEDKVIVQNPDRWKEINLKEHGIKELRFNLQNMGIQEGKAAIHRWALPSDKLTKLSPLFKLLMICIVIGVIGWASMKFGTYVLDVVMKSRLIDCAQVLPNYIPEPIPIDAITTNVTQQAPAGVT